MAKTSAPAFEQPPYGHMNAHFMRDLDTRVPPERFRLNGRPATLDEWNRWVEAEIADMADFLWPRWTKQGWRGQATATAQALTAADLDLMTGPDGLMAQLLAKVEGRGVAASSVTHKQLFEAEDLALPGERYEVYDKEVDEALLGRLRDSMRRALVAFGPAPLQYKLHFQRARPYQEAWRLGREFPYEWAKSAVTPALISGHAIQGALACVAAYVEHRRALESIAGAVGLLQRLAVDFGDRRVFAGVHYPSDNLASWYALLRVLPQLYLHPVALEDARRFLWQAIGVHSKVHAAMRAHAAQHEGSPFAGPLRRLEAEAAKAKG